jgi:1,6-anhydro-N-acetylmuramate kinase
MARATFTNLPGSETRIERAADPDAARKNRSARRHHGTRYVAGCMTGTSLDGLDAALVAIDGNGLTMRSEVVRETSRPLGELSGPLRRLCAQEAMDAGAICALARALATLHLDALHELGKGQNIDLIALHGQTIYHAPPLSWQLCDPATIAAEFKAPVVFNLRAADLAAGGEGAPITPLADYLLFRHLRERRTVVNLGGFCNLTRLPAGEDTRQISGGDLCACNQLLDSIARARLGMPFDRDGAAAARGETVARALQSLGAALELQARAKRSLGTGDELAPWLAQHQQLSGADLSRTACAAIAQQIARHAQPCDRLILAGGGTRNRTLVAELRGRAGMPVQVSDELGIPASLREPVAMAVLGALCQDRVPITLKQVTGCERAPVSGWWVLP